MVTTQMSHYMNIKNPPARLRDQRGQSMIEVLVAMMLSTVALTISARDFGYYVHHRHDMTLLAETQQAADSSMTFLTQELRQAGACLPGLGNFITLDGEDNGDHDSLTLRIGITDDYSLQCNRTILKARALQNTSEMKLESTAGFEVGQWLYLIKNTGYGQFFKIVSVEGQWVTVDGTFKRNFGRNSGVYAIEERVYEIVQYDGVSTLTVAIDGDDPQPMARGIESFDVQYRMAPCPPCDAVDIPTSDTEWRVVREVEISVTAKSDRPGSDGKHLEVENKATIKPRNLI